ncbi:lipopolysaccharide biosynthesis protein [Phocaeicola sp.]
MNRRISYNLGSAIIVQAVSIGVGLLMPRMVIAYYGSTVNGLMVTITQLVSYFGLLEGSVAISAGASLYEYFATSNQVAINRVFSAVSIFYKRSGLFFLIILVLISFFFAIDTSDQLPFCTTLIVMMSAGIMSILGYVFFNKYNMIFLITGRHYISLLSSCIYYIVLTIVQYLLIINGFTVEVVVLFIPLFSLIRLMWMRRYVRKLYPFLSFKTQPMFEAIKEKYNALFVNVAAITKTLIPILYLSVLFDLKYVSVYSVYAMIFHLGSSIFETFSNGITPFFGNLLALGDRQVIKDYYYRCEMLSLISVSFISLCLLLLTIPFVNLYIVGSNDISYIAPILMMSFVINEALVNLRFTSKTLIKANGEFRHIRYSGFVEMAISLLLTPVFCCLFGYEFVLVPSIIGSLYQLFFYSGIVKRFYGISRDGRFYYIMISVGLLLLICLFFIKIEAVDIITFILLSLVVALLAALIILGIVCAFERKMVGELLKLILRKR